MLARSPLDATALQRALERHKLDAALGGVVDQGEDCDSADGCSAACERESTAAPVPS